MAHSLLMTDIASVNTRLICPTARWQKSRQSLARKIILFFRTTIRCIDSPVPSRMRGVRVVTNVGRDAMDAAALQDGQCLSRTAKSCGPGTPWLVPSWRQCPAHCADDGD